MTKTEKLQQILIEIKTELNTFIIDKNNFYIKNEHLIYTKTDISNIVLDILKPIFEKHNLVFYISSYSYTNPLLNGFVELHIFFKN